MEALQKIPFKFDGLDYEIRVGKFDDVIKVRAFHDDKPANPWTYSVDYVTAVDFAESQGQSAWQHLVELARADVECRRLERLRAELEEQRSKR